MKPKHRSRRSTKQTCRSWQAREWWKVLLIPAMFTRQHPPGASGGISALQLKVVNKLSRRLNVSQELTLPTPENNFSRSHSVSASSLLPPPASSTSLNRWQSPGLMCPLSRGLGAKMQTHCEAFLVELIRVRLTRVSRLFIRKDTATLFPGVRLHGTVKGFLDCVYFFLMSWLKPREKAEVSVSAPDIPGSLTCELLVRRLRVCQLSGWLDKLTVKKLRSCFSCYFFVKHSLRIFPQHTSDL